MKPSGYAYEYSGWGIRFTNGGEYNGSKPLRAIPYLLDPKPVWLVATGETHEGQETYTRHDVCPPLCDAELLFT
jgi:hypothetical protein